MVSKKIFKVACVVNINGEKKMLNIKNIGERNENKQINIFKQTLQRSALHKN